jgi:hypothetical protein
MSPSLLKMWVLWIAMSSHPLAPVEIFWVKADCVEAMTFYIQQKPRELVCALAYVNVPIK